MSVGFLPFFLPSFRSFSPSHCPLGGEGRGLAGVRECFVSFALLLMCVCVCVCVVGGGGGGWGEA